MPRVTDEMVSHWLIWARNFGEIVAYHTGRGPYRYERGNPRRFRVRLTPGVTADGHPFRPKEGIFDLFGHEAKDVVPPELAFTAREALAFGMGCAAGRAGALAGYGEDEWQREWTPAEREAFTARREEARRANREDFEREQAEYDAERKRRIAEFRRRRDAASRVLPKGNG